jgi:hypothetical protein
MWTGRVMMGQMLLACYGGIQLNALGDGKMDVHKSRRSND